MNVNRVLRDERHAARADVTVRIDAAAVAGGAGRPPQPFPGGRVERIDHFVVLHAMEDDHPLADDRRPGIAPSSLLVHRGLSPAGSSLAGSTSPSRLARCRCGPQNLRPVPGPQGSRKARSQSQGP